MKDNEFDRLLSQSMKEYGHEYLHGADGPAGTGPVPVHKFRDDFISDIAVNKPKKKPGVLRCVRFAGAAAAVFVAAAALMIVPQLINRSSDITNNNIVKAPPESTVSQKAVNNTAIYDADYDSTDSVDSINDEKTNSQASAGEPGISYTSPAKQGAADPERSDRQKGEYSYNSWTDHGDSTMHEENPAYEDEPACEAPGIDYYSETENVIYTININGNAKEITPQELDTIIKALSDGISPQSRWHLSEPYTEDTLIAEITLESDPQGGRFNLKGTGYDTVNIRLFPSKAFITLTRGEDISQYHVDKTTEAYQKLSEQLSDIS